jgi:hypothetical protein
VKALTRAFGVDAHHEARKRQREADSAEAAREWRAVARAALSFLKCAAREPDEPATPATSRAMLTCSYLHACAMGSPQENVSLRIQYFRNFIRK